MSLYGSPSSSSTMRSHNRSFRGEQLTPLQSPKGSSASLIPPPDEAQGPGRKAARPPSPLSARVLASSSLYIAQQGSLAQPAPSLRKATANPRSSARLAGHNGSGPSSPRQSPRVRAASFLNFSTSIQAIMDRNARKRHDVDDTNPTTHHQAPKGTIGVDGGFSPHCRLSAMAPPPPSPLASLSLSMSPHLNHSSPTAPNPSDPSTSLLSRLGQNGRPDTLSRGSRDLAMAWRMHAATPRITTNSADSFPPCISSRAVHGSAADGMAAYKARDSEMRTGVITSPSDYGVRDGGLYPTATPACSATVSRAALRIVRSWAASNGVKSLQKLNWDGISRSFVSAHMLPPSTLQKGSLEAVAKPAAVLLNPKHHTRFMDSVPAISGKSTGWGMLGIEGITFASAAISYAASILPNKTISNYFSLQDCQETLASTGPRKMTNTPYHPTSSAHPVKKVTFQSPTASSSHRADLRDPSPKPSSIPPPSHPCTSTKYRTGMGPDYTHPLPNGWRSVTGSLGGRGHAADVNVEELKRLTKDTAGTAISTRSGKGLPRGGSCTLAYNPLRRSGVSRHLSRLSAEERKRSDHAIMCGAFDDTSPEEEEESAEEMAEMRLNCLSAVKAQRRQCDRAEKEEEKHEAWEKWAEWELALGDTGMQDFFLPHCILSKTPQAATVDLAAPTPVATLPRTRVADPIPPWVFVGLGPTTAPAPEKVPAQNAGKSSEPKGVAPRWDEGMLSDGKLLMNRVLDSIVDLDECLLGNPRHVPRVMLVTAPARALKIAAALARNRHLAAAVLGPAASACKDGFGCVGRGVMSFIKRASFCVFPMGQI